MSPTGTLRLLLADDHEMVRRGVRSLLEGESGWEVCGEATNGREAVHMARTLKPDIAIIDIGMPELNGLETVRQIRAEVPTCQVIVLTCHDSEQIVREALQAGARGYVLKTDGGARLLSAVNALREQSTFLTPRVESLVLAGYLHGEREAAIPAPRLRTLLSPREREVVQLLAEGNSNKQIAAMLGVSVRTAETHRTNVMRKLELHCLSDLVRYAIRNGLAQA